MRGSYQIGQLRDVTPKEEISELKLNDEKQSALWKTGRKIHWEESIARTKATSQKRS